MTSFTGAFCNVGWASIRYVEKEMPHLPDINQGRTASSAGHQSGMYREKVASAGHQSGSHRRMLDLNQVRRREKLHMLRMLWVIIDTSAPHA